MKKLFFRKQVNKWTSGETHTLKTHKVLSKNDLNQFLNFPHQLYKEDKNYVPSLNIVVKEMLSHKNPFLKHSEIALFLAIENENVVGRIAAIYNKTHLDTYNDNTGFFGFFDAINDGFVAKSLLEICEQWLAEKGVKRIIGPANLTTNDSCGVLIDGFSQPMILMPYNKVYYNDLCTQSGYVKLIDLYSYKIPNGISFERYNNIYLRGLDVMNSNGIKIRNMSKKTFQKDIEQLRFVYNKVNENNWGFMPLNVEEFKAMAAELQMTTPWDFTLVVEKENEIIGFLIAVPNLNQAFKFVKNGKLFPFGIFKFLLKKHTINSARIMILGVLDEYKGMGIDLILYQRIKEACYKRKIFEAEACYVLENNQRMNGVLSKLSGGIVKKYRMYEKEIQNDVKAMVAGHLEYIKG
jgi:ribosomal protein S18 acetylase RimI-like enzyme